MGKTSVLAITKNGIKMSSKLKAEFPDWTIYAPEKFSGQSNSVISWYSEPTSKKVGDLFQSSDALICLFSLGAVIRLIAPYIKDKKSDPAVIVIDDKSEFVISALSGHLGGANQLTKDIAEKLEARPVITTAADVNKTIPVDLVGKEFGWIIDDDSTVTKISALMVNEEKIGVWQNSGNKGWWKREFPKNVIVYDTLEQIKDSDAKGFLIITDRKLGSKEGGEKKGEESLAEKSVVYRPKSLVVGVGLHWNTTKEKIRDCLQDCFDKNNLSLKSIAKFVSIKKPKDVKGLIKIATEMNVPIEYYQKEELADVNIPNPSETVKKFEGTPSVSEAAALKGSFKGDLVVQKQKFPPDLTIAVARITEY